ncbi:MAG: hypothetical protein ACI9ON_000576 [Limisphaerales bacterium]|jgi:hypothetical protein
MPVVEQNLKYFLVAILGIGVIGFLLLRLIGYPLIHLAFLDPNRDAPMWIMQGTPAGELVTVQGVQANEWLATYGAVFAGGYELQFLAEGQAHPGGDVAMVYFDQAKNIVRALTDSEYPLSLEPNGRIIGSYEPLPKPLPAVLIVWLAKRSHDQVVSPFGLVEAQQEPRAPIVWQAKPVVLADDTAADSGGETGADAWDDMMIMGFSDTSAATQWLTARETKLVRELVRARTVALNVAVLCHRETARCNDTLPE